MSDAEEGGPGERNEVGSSGWIEYFTACPGPDSVIYATALSHGAVVWTQDTDFETLPGVRFTPKG